jgi:hypothetical protein
MEDNMTRTSAQRYNDRMYKLFERAKELSAKNAPIHAIQILKRMTEKVERANNIQHSGGHLIAEDWAELYALTSQSRGILENASKYIQDNNIQMD